MNYGGFWIRFLAYLVDSVIVVFALFVLLVPIAFLGEAGAQLIPVLCVAGPVLYWSLMQASARQATFGKALLGLKVTDLSGGRLSVPRSLIREVAKYISAIPLMIGFVLAAFTKRKQALHDLFASTTVAREGKAHLVAALVVGIFGWLAPAMVVMFLGVGVIAAMMGIMGAGMVQQAMNAPQKQQVAQVVHAPAKPAASAPQKPAVPVPQQPAAAPQALAAQTTAPAASTPKSAATPVPAVAEPPPSVKTTLIKEDVAALLATPLGKEAGTTLAGPALLALPPEFHSARGFSITVNLPARKEFEDNPVSVVITRVVDRNGIDVYDAASTASGTIDRVRLRPASFPVNHLSGPRPVIVKEAKDVERVEGFVHFMKDQFPFTLKRNSMAADGQAAGPASARPAPAVAAAPAAHPAVLVAEAPKADAAANNQNTKPKPVELAIPAEAPVRPMVATEGVAAVHTKAAPAETALATAPPAPAAPAVVAAVAPTSTLRFNDLITATLYRDVEAVNELLAFGKWPDKPDSRGLTPLMIAAMFGDASIAEALLKAGANPNRPGPGGDTAVSIARERKDTGMLGVLKQHGGN